MTDKIERDDKLTCIDRLRLHAEDPETFPADFDDISETVDLVDRLRSSNEAMRKALEWIRDVDFEDAKELQYLNAKATIIERLSSIARAALSLQEEEAR